MKRRTFFPLLIVLTLLLAILPSYVFAQEESIQWVRLLDAEGAVVGFVTLTQEASSVKVDVAVSGLPAGFHGIQIHAAGYCDTDDVPFAPILEVLGSDSAEHPNRIGDLPPLLVLQDGTGAMSTNTDRFTLADLMDDNGSSIMIYANSSIGNTGDMGSGLACGALQDIDGIVEREGNLWAVERLPLDSLPATIYRGENAEEADLTLSLLGMQGVQLPGRIEGKTPGAIGQVNIDGDFLVFTFDSVDYNVYPIELPGGFSLGQQTIELDSNQQSTLRVNLTTGEIQREFFWIQTATDVVYNGEPSIPLGDTARTQVAEVRNLGNNRYLVRMLTNWRSTLEIDTWSVGGIELPSGNIEATADFDGVYILDFNS